MAQDYDVSLKLLFHHSHGVIATELFGGPVREWVNIELPKVNNPRVDLLARCADGSLRHVEVQTSNESDIARRQAEYYLGFHRLLGEHVEQVMLYASAAPLRMSNAFETPSMRYEFRLLNMREFDGEPLLASDDWGDNLLALLTKVEQIRVLERIESQLRRLKGEEQDTAARLYVIISGIVGIEDVVSERLNMIDIMANRVLGPAVLKGSRRTIATLLDQKFGPLPEWAVEQLEQAGEAQLDRLTLRLLTAATLEDVFRG
ncbi:MAG: hypothetical protein JNL98_34755 [Bryobacterales bacterium]|nr:hypothetical protein [Bryobacterales bacterium]